MTLKKIISFILIIFFVFFNWFVFWDFQKNQNIKIVDILSKDIYLESQKLNKTVVVVYSLNDVSNYKIHSNCKIDTNLLEKKDNYYFFELSFLDKNCKNWNFYFKNEKIIYLNSFFKLNLFSFEENFLNFSKYKEDELDNLRNNLENKYIEFREFANYKNSIYKYNLFKKSRTFFEIQQKIEFIDYLINLRKEKYKIPIVWEKLPEKNLSKLPNSKRPYRENYTNWIHEWWDIDANLWKEIVSIDDWIIIRIVKDFKFEDLKKLNKSKKLSQEQKLNNLDILRWNQIWLQTSKWDIIFYSHLDKIFDGIKVWDFVKKWYKIATVWKTWVPVYDYKDFHLHFELRKNSFKTDQKNYTFIDFMKWDWYFKWKNSDFILKNQYNIFQK